jgi:glycogen debranching enzyme
MLSPDRSHTADPAGDVPGLAPLLADEGWAYASSLPTAAGDPGRYHALFGRDSLITALQVLPARPDVARSTLHALAARQGRAHDPATLEAPGKMGHEFRDQPPETFVGWPAGPFAYYGTADATSWFLVLLAALDDDAVTTQLTPHWRAAAGWLAAELDAGDGLVRYRQGSRGALTHQGWRDCIDPVDDGNGGGTVRADGTAPRPPLADADTQAVTVAALRALARLSGDAQWQTRHDRMRALVTRTYLPDVVMVDADGPIAGAGSQLGWLLWADALEADAVAAAAQRLCEPDVRTGYGLRTLSSDVPAFAPDAYHRGSIWPFDSWLGWGGLRAAGRVEEAEAVRTGVLAAIAELGGYPELYGVTTAEGLFAVPAANRVQAWTVGAAWALRHEWDGRPSGRTALRGDAG